MNRDTGLSLFALAIAALGIIVAVILIMMATPAGAVECQAEHDSRSYWSWRSIDGRRCWYRGHSVLPKSSLYWPDKKPEKKPEKKIKMDPVSTIRAEDTGLPAPKTRAPLRSNQPMEIVTDGCCWPTLTEFELMWDKIMQTLKSATKGVYDDSR